MTRSRGKGTVSSCTMTAKIAVVSNLILDGVTVIVSSLLKEPPIAVRGRSPCLQLLDRHIYTAVTTDFIYMYSDSCYMYNPLCRTQGPTLPHSSSQSSECQTSHYRKWNLCFAECHSSSAALGLYSSKSHNFTCIFSLLHRKKQSSTWELDLLLYMEKQHTNALT